MKKGYFYLGVILPVCGLFFNSCKSDDPVAPPDAKGIKCQSDTIFIEYGKTLDLSTVFSIDPADAAGTISYSVNRQPSYVEGNDTETEYTTVTAYSLSGSTLTSINGIRVPNAVHTDGRNRVVREGRLTATLTGATTTIEPKEVVIVQTNKPALIPIITIALNPAGLTDGPNGKLLTIGTTGAARNFTSSTFTIMPIDFSPEDIIVRPSPNSQYINSPSQGSAATNAGGLNGKPGTGDYVIGFYSESKTESAIQQALTKALALPSTSTEAARLYVNVEAVAPNAVVGIVLNEDAIGKKGNASFWRNNANGRQLPQNFILMKLNDGTTRAFDGSTDKTVLAGEFDQYLEGRTEEDENNPGWWSYVALKQNSELPPVGTEVTFTITYKPNFNQEGWTVKVKTKTTAANPES